MSLARYRGKRDFSVTPEPPPVKRSSGKTLSYFIQRHHARTLHYDFRLEVDGVLKSWAVPKGPSLDPRDKRLAIQVEDHPYDYGSFEGTIPAHQYGAGEVVLWDRGEWLPLGDPAAGLEKGRLEFELRGAKLSGRWVLVRMSKGDSAKENWLLIKENDDAARTGKQAMITELRPESVAPTAGKASAPKGNGAGSAPEPSAQDRTETVEGIRLTHPDKMLFADVDLTKLDLAKYYVAVADWILPHIQQRPMTMVRCPDGRDGKCFFQRHLGRGAPAAVKKIVVPEGEGSADYMMVNDIAGLVATVQMDVLELHTWGSKEGKLLQPDRAVFDLDPGPDVPWNKVIDGVRLLHSLLAEIGLVSFLKTSGGKGLHVVLPIVPEHDWDTVRDWSRSVAEHMARVQPDYFIAKMAKSARRGKIFIDYLRNAPGATTVAAYSPRARPGAPVSAPLSWTELRPEIRADSFTVSNVLQRLGSLQRDPWQDYANTNANQRLDKEILALFSSEREAP
ncbi:non-homologous end-joining DNA ligase [Herbaspirillum sp. RV1423]|uniref:non-homologous end-joining DNA ligase n=1 Tax=Herbaspirillum sp. RV1423 TaxID=1443993 RepID=UPI0004B50818|nr:non-homologous end-joining DNA ligase [Herbaspirillum sp. RV1423]